MAQGGGYQPQSRENLSGVSVSLAEHHQNISKLQIGPSRVKSMYVAGVLMVLRRCSAGVLVALHFDCILLETPVSVK